MVDAKNRIALAGSGYNIEYSIHGKQVESHQVCLTKWMQTEANRCLNIFILSISPGITSDVYVMYSSECILNAIAMHLIKWRNGEMEKKKKMIRGSGNIQLDKYRFNVAKVLCTHFHVPQHV